MYATIVPDDLVEIGSNVKNIGWNMRKSVESATVANNKNIFLIMDILAINICLGLFPKMILSILMISG